ncbi:MAG TPA: nuclear transport factor 2 family protein [Hydrogenophaga sp.]|uniref:nuclear transport factor 2 family protein n=1 Tax=Hydrogenophaga sp. TaxID=1904254 RepID=UPI002CF1EF61|nr:nuclear transport factor 2 family protein [Hydrogenophaga sp.]HMN94406.1 nuclear transport factor 2 family protein [Hydrogenophaga sp.]HMP11410.1 nuclear transport factor 2 family protein [Hydrogenophaga sp.]
MSAEALREQIRAQVRTAVAAHTAPDQGAAVAALMQRFEAGYATANAEAIVACFAPDVVWALPDARVLNGRAACLAFLKERFASPAGPQFADSRMHVLGRTVVQNYKVSLPLPGGQTVTLDGADVYQIRDGLIARKDAYWKQIGAGKPGTAAAPAAPGAASVGVVVPLRVGTAAGIQALSELYKRLAASPALLQAAQNGVLRFDLRVDEGHALGTSAMAATTAIGPAACCESCKAGKSCDCKGDHCDLHEHKTAEAVPELHGVIGEKLLRTLPPGVKTVRLHPKAVMTPLGKDALRKRGITIDRGAQP